ncbi:conserved hypothetical protein [Histoplasma capsulatum G186AR]|uniref:Uncharacterized protein n=2 Tax=Ajellomyces capsulatus TaxID=5037 RepID=C0NC64_AJECG|nr:uncharacterized protein HCBG_00710 [Histoplasma capsulatum G186AR]EEH11255.1 conserved hypothetical protein [Histoplasma capsulatum G186AR]KAG5302903.1 hypothetical protein I7I52_00696 [Histoplasma capsulatum]QSS71697.1 hypothetical protein I7I50_02638 [Histoplasma capsulatum G186AR]
MIQHDGETHHPLGAGSYYFKEHLINYLNDQCSRPSIALHVGSQPNCSPHIGNLTTFTVTFALAAALRKEFRREVRVKFVYVDSAPSPGQEANINGVIYQRSLKHTGDLEDNQTTFMKVLDQLSQISGIAYDVETQNLWLSHPAFPGVLRIIVAQHEVLGPHMSPDRGKLAIRASCPHDGCGLTDKHGVNNQYLHDGRITFACPNHGEHHVSLSSASDLKRLEFNTPLRNLIRILICSQDPDKSWIMCTGSDYAGFYQEQFTWRLLECPAKAPIIFYSPLIIDWSGGKLSKSLYVKKGAYKYLCDAGRRYMLDADTFMKTEGALNALFAEIQDWVEEPRKLFRNYSIDYIDKQLISRGMKLVQGNNSA